MVSTGSKEEIWIADTVAMKGPSVLLLLFVDVAAMCLLFSLLFSNISVFRCFLYSWYSLTELTYRFTIFIFLYTLLFVRFFVHALWFNKLLIVFIFKTFLSFLSHNKSNWFCPFPNQGNERTRRELIPLRPFLVNLIESHTNGKRFWRDL